MVKDMYSNNWEHKMKVLVLSCSTGGGHNACGHYIENEFKENNIECDFVDYFNILGPNAKEYSEKIYLDTTKGNGKVFKVAYKLGEAYSKTRITSPVYGFNKLMKNKVYSFIKENNYDLVITPHLFPAMAITALKEEGKDIKLINVATDYHAIPFLEETKPDYFVIPHISLQEEFLKKGFKQEILLPYGICVSSLFCKVKNNLSLPQDKNIILITSGSMGFGKMEDIVKAILNNIPNTYVVALCGSNKKLYLELKEINSENLLVKGFVTNINEYISSSTIVLTKPGGLTSTEVGVIRKPMIHLMLIPGVENYNANFFEKNGLSLISNNIEEVISNTEKLLKDEKLQKEMIKNQAEFINRNSANDLVQFVINNANAIYKSQKMC